MYPTDNFSQENQSKSRIDDISGYLLCKNVWCAIVLIYQRTTQKKCTQIPAAPDLSCRQTSAVNCLERAGVKSAALLYQTHAKRERRQQGERDQEDERETLWGDAVLPTAALSQENFPPRLWIFLLTLICSWKMNKHLQSTWVSSCQPIGSSTAKTNK